MIATDLTEKQWAAQISDLAKMLGYLRYHTYRSDRSPAGFPDEVLVRDRVIFMELKRELTGKRSVDRARAPSVLQVEWLDRLTRAGAECYLARPADLEEVARVLGKAWKHGGHALFEESVSLSAHRASSWTPGCMWIPGQGRFDTIEAARAAEGEAA